jgi:hypothetical protein
VNESGAAQPKKSVWDSYRVRFGVGASALGLFLFAVGADPGLFELDRSPVVGFVQIAVFLIGLGIVCLGGYVGLSSLWNGDGKSIPADIGQRLVATGYVIAVASGMADLLGFGSQQLPQVPYFGSWQITGVMIGQAVIGVGFVLLIPFKKSKIEEEHN